MRSNGICIHGVLTKSMACRIVAESVDRNGELEDFLYTSNAKWIYLEESGLVRLDTRREDITQSTFKELQSSTALYMLPPRKVFTARQHSLLCRALY